MDKAAISLSLLCLVHCLVTPVAIMTLPALGATFLDGEGFHIAILFLVLPASLFGLGFGCLKHRRAGIVVTELLVLSLLCLVLIPGENAVGEVSEKVSTVAGTALIAFAHVRNFMLCQNRNCH